ncbi:MAG: hypothetical protein L3K26_10600 [Candidatus Hydrogenedentes bacterium]|nr:hypothetical protein [Candidatus Hydrogenedentota bacterium]
MIYYKTSQIVPGKGNAWMYYECDDDKKVLRTLTHIPEADETTRVSDPIVKRLIRPDILQDADGEEFLRLWGDA